MAVNSSISLTSLDFADYKNSLKTYLQSQPQFADYNFDASNMSVLLDILSYNTYLNAFYMNMIGSEMFLDTAQLRDSVVLRAKELNYCPRSFRGAQATVNLVVANVAGNAAILTIPAGTSFSTRAGSNSYTFSTQQNIIVNANTDGKFYCSNVTITEGTVVTDTFVVLPANALPTNTQSQQFILSNPTIDTTTLTVASVENNGANVIPYLQSTSLLDLTTNSAVYFLQGADNSRYQIIFGDNVVGRRPPDNSVVIASYLATNGQLPNGISRFTPNSTLGGSSNITVTTVAPASGGDIGEDIASIKYNAPRYYATQERCITTSDYETLLTVTYPEIEAISVYGGDVVNPPQYGKVFISLKLYNSAAVPQSEITKYTQFLSTRAPLTILPVFVEPDYTYISVKTTVKYNVNQSPLQPSDIAAFVTSAIQNYNLQHLENFGVTLLYSRLVEAIDNADPSIISNQSDFQIMKKIVPQIGISTNYTVNFNAQLSQSEPPLPMNYSSTVEPAISSSQFTYNGLQVTLADDGAGIMRLVETGGDGNVKTVQTVGTVDYTTGIVQLVGFAPSAFVGDSIRIYAELPDSMKDYTVLQNVILEIPNDEISVSVTQVRQ